MRQADGQDATRFAPLRATRDGCSLRLPLISGDHVKEACEESTEAEIAKEALRQSRDYCPLWT